MMDITGLAQLLLSSHVFKLVGNAQGYDVKIPVVIVGVRDISNSEWKKCIEISVRTTGAPQVKKVKRCGS